MRTERFAWLCLAAGVALGCTSNTSFRRDGDTGGGAGESATGGTATGGIEGDTGGQAAGGNATGGGEAGGSGGTKGGTTSGGSDSGGSDSGGSGGQGGGSGGGTAQGGVSAGGTETGGTPAGGEGGGGSVASPVSGALIDFWGHPLANVPMDVGGTLTVTDTNGEFEVADVAEEYDVSLLVEFGLDAAEVYGWVFQGLTRRDPTLQIYSGLPQRSGSFSLTQSGGEFTANRTLTVAFGGPDGASSRTGLGESGLGSASALWRGPSQTTTTAHGLLWQFDASTDMPTDYLAYDTAPAVLAPGSPFALQLDLTSEDIAAGNLQTTVTASGFGSRTNRAFVHFDTGAAIEIARDYRGLDTFTYLVPTLPNSSVTVVASEGGDSYYMPFGLAHADGLASSSMPELTIPTPVTLLQPADGASGVDASTAFAFSGGSDAGRVRLVSIQHRDVYSGIYIVTTNEQFTIPDVVQGSYQLPGGGFIDWYVETHGEYNSVDDAAEPGGFLDPFGATDAPVGPRRRDGSFTQSGYRTFSLAP